MALPAASTSVPANQAVMVSTRCYNHQLLQNRRVKIGQLEEFDIGSVPERHFPEWSQPCNDDSGNDASKQGRRRHHKSLLE